jgi:hypothetical protein
VCVCVCVLPKGAELSGGGVEEAAVEGDVFAGLREGEIDTRTHTREVFPVLKGVDAREDHGGAAGVACCFYFVCVCVCEWLCD